MPDDQHQPQLPALASPLAHYDAARHALAEAVRIDDVKSIRDKAIALQAYAKQAGDREMLDRATDIRKWAERRGGEVLREMKIGGERESQGGDHKSKSRVATLNLADLGITKSQSSLWQRLAKMPLDEFEQLVQSVRDKVVDTLDRRGRPDAAAQRGQPNRSGPDFWPTPPCLTSALVRFVLPDLPPGLIWECATGDGRLVQAMQDAGRDVIATDLYPQDGSIPCDFLTAEPPADETIAVTNPPFNKSDEFLTRGLELHEAGKIAGLVLLLRHDHLMAASRVAAFNRAVREVHCNWRPIWIPDTEGNPRWSFHWLAWHAGRRRPPLYLSQNEIEDAST